MLGDDGNGLHFLGFPVLSPNGCQTCQIAGHRPVILDNGQSSLNGCEHDCSVGVVGNEEPGALPLTKTSLSLPGGSP